MRMYALLVLTVGLLPAADAPKNDGAKNEAEKLFRTMEEKLEKAKTLECVFEVKMDAHSYKGSLSLAEGNKACLKINEATEGRRMRCLIVSTGTRLSYQDNGMNHPKLEDTPKSLNAEILTWMARSGVFLPQAPLPPVKADDAKDRFRVSGFKLGNKEKVGERDAQRLDYQLTVKGNQAPPSFSVTVWVDLKTGLPVKRTVGEGNATLTTESYGEITLNEKVDTKKFDLPKEVSPSEVVKQWIDAAAKRDMKTVAWLASTTTSKPSLRLIEQQGFLKYLRTTVSAPVFGAGGGVPVQPAASVA